MPNSNDESSDSFNYYIVLESVSTNSSKVVHVINLQYTDEIRIG
jgi:hypothetical protein